MPQKVVTDKDKDILEALLRNTEIKFSVIAKKFGIPMSSVYRVYNKLRDMGILKGRLYIVDYSKIGLPILANFTIEISGDEKKVMEFLRHCENMKYMTFGSGLKARFLMSFYSLQISCMRKKFRGF